MDDMRAERDELAELCGWIRNHEGWALFQCVSDCKTATCVSWKVHPFPHGDLTALTGAWPEDEPVSFYRRRKSSGSDEWEWTVVADNRHDRATADTMYDAWLPVALAVRRAMKERAHA